ncbi:MAG: DNA polymerase III subunit delta [Bdellovibrionales bacterium]|nr:DNA polymerase III subunit delta [Oligoflexia bacterium]
MPKLEPKIIQKELEASKLRPVYFIFGPERMKSRELVKRIQKVALKGAPPNDFNFEKLDGGEAGMEGILDAAQSFSLMGGTKLILIRNAEEVKNLDGLGDYLKSLGATDPAPVETFSSILIFLSKNFDGRKKASKTIQDLGAVIPCEEVSEQDREPWIEYLSKRRGVTLSPDERLTLRGQDPWSLDIIDQEISKLELVGEDAGLRAESLMSGVSAYARDEFIDALFCRDQKRALKLVHLFTEDMEVQLPFLGLLAWNLRHLKLFILEQETKSRSSERRNPFLLKNLERWRKHWSLATIQLFEHELFTIDFSLKNTRLLGKGLWLNAVLVEGKESRG